jgi:hypothetical protein
LQEHFVLRQYPCRSIFRGGEDISSKGQYGMQRL